MPAQDNAVPPVALHGLKVVECATVIAGPLCGRLLSDFGAEVIHVEPPGKGDPLRQFGFHVDGVNPWWKYYSRNKKLVTLDIGKPQGREVLLKLLADADIFVENFRPGRLEAWGIHYEDLEKINPRLVMIRLTGYGQTGPYAKQPGFGTIMEAQSGFAHMTGETDGPPTLPQFALADSFAGMYAVAAAMFAIYNRDIVGTGKGQVIDVSILESLYSMLGPNSTVYQLTGEAPGRMGNRTPTSAPRNTYRTSDGRWLAIAGATPTTAARLLMLVGGQALVDDPRFNTNSGRLKNVVKLDALIGGWIGRHTLAEVTGILRAADVPFGPVNTIADIMADPHAQAREMVIEQLDDNGRTLKMEGVFPKMSATPGRVQHPGRSQLGADNVEIFVRRLGMNSADVETLKAAGII